MSQLHTTLEFFYFLISVDSMESHLLHIWRIDQFEKSHKNLRFISKNNQQEEVKGKVLISLQIIFLLYNMKMKQLDRVQQV